MFISFFLIFAFCLSGSTFLLFLIISSICYHLLSTEKSIIGVVYHSYIIRISFVYHSYIIPISFLYHSYIIRISFVYHSYIIPISFLYHSYIIPISFLYDFVLSILITIYILTFSSFDETKIKK